MDTKHLWTYNRLQKQASEKADHIPVNIFEVVLWLLVSLLMEQASRLAMEKQPLTLHAYVVGFGKSGRKYIPDKV